MVIDHSIENFPIKYSKDYLFFKTSFFKAITVE